ncbi:Uncharacterized metal-binding protein YceD, DUF177 family [Meinhardsimonia xiamenensis]|jgi:uncharacterized metal-binding protein YceD (DUF177 family)|uniref:Uncharacterized metal-binding protein YceD, DUF177 family n=1 Tax=Meinhardsimonia xiamenensis TaxID=990712 RepID=A0A1G9BDY0_9RHOB|nr:YceD family protein [Meinhardsimonia xiamenensis]PRX35016.1 uncharacterized metal-binding protein YceD (DUF177 family) [Meinhardsimonia xiamenensis]SDK37683.1 Uncharacterized metal-binding protein YceD, DUF177 family [Meinhardsimonia xiamenensis]
MAASSGKSRNPSPRLPARFRPATLSRQTAHDFELRPDAETRARLMQALGLTGLRKLRLAGRLIPEGAADWRLEAVLGATVVQPCVVSLEPVTTRIDEPVTRLYRAEPAPEPAAAEIEMPAETDEEAMSEMLDLEAILAEALALALPDFPRAPGAELGQAAFGAPEGTPEQPARIHPFAALAALKGKLDGKS